MKSIAIWLISLALALPGLGAPSASAKGAGQMGAPGGVTLAGSPYRYVAIAPRSSGPLTIVERIEKGSGRVSRWWRLPGKYHVPAVAYDGSGGGLSADGSKLVISHFSRTYPPHSSRFAVIDLQRYLRVPRGVGDPQPRHAIRRLTLNGDFSFDAISPDGSTIYLIHHQLPSSSGPAYIASYEVRALDTTSGKLLPQPIVDPSEPDERMTGLPVSRQMSPDGRWAYTLYDGNGETPFLHALDTVKAEAVCVDLPQLADRRNLFLLALRIDQQGRELTVLNRPSASPQATRPLLAVDTRSFEVSEPSPVEAAAGDSPPWLSIGVGSTVLLLGLAWAIGRRWRPSRGSGFERA
jgi:hypothetical protein